MIRGLLRRQDPAGKAGSVNLGVENRSWTRHFVYRRAFFKTTWKFKLAIASSVVLLLSLTRTFWIPRIGRSLVCQEQIGHADAILVDNFDVNYLLFERAAALHNLGLSPRVLVPTMSSDLDGPSVAIGILDVMTRVARLENPETIHLREIEPISLNAAYQIRKYLIRQHIRSVIVVASGFRSKRSLLVYETVLGRAGIDLSCVPVFGQKTPDTWTKTWHGIQEVLEQFIKLEYYRFYVLPLDAWKETADRRS
jgi:hypothetical protein